MLIELHLLACWSRLRDSPSVVTTKGLRDLVLEEGLDGRPSGRGLADENELNVLRVTANIRLAAQTRERWHWNGPPWHPKAIQRCTSLRP